MNASLKNSCFIGLTGCLLLPGIAVPQPELTTSLTDCVLSGNCMSSTEASSLDFAIEGWDPISFMLPNCSNTTCTESKNNISVSVFPTPGQTNSFTFEYSIDSSDTCPQASGNVFNPEVSCTATDQTTTKTVSLNARITNLQCVRDTGNNEYSLTWDSQGCGDEEVLVTLVTDNGVTVQMQVSNEGNHAFTPSTEGLRLAYIAPVVSADGKGDGEAVCQNVDRLPPADTIRSKIHSAFVMNQPLGANQPGPLRAEQTYQLMFDAPPEAFISIASMKVHSNDQFLGFSDSGLPLFNATTGQPLYSQPTDVTNELHLWNAGTEKDEKSGVGKGQPMRGNAETPADSLNWVRCDDNRFGNIPGLASLASADIQHVGQADNGNHRFTLNFRNEGARFTPNPGCDAIEEVFAPGICVVHSEGNPLFTAGRADYGDGLEQLAEDGDPQPLFINLQSQMPGSASKGAISSFLIVTSLVLVSIL